ncbi:hypothetical protein EC957_002587 [Mortierella hygrophila]|uniref:Uncharacterized protein n=1 Tax=Mortierella hygrophila TaxID=979708 RepID=A0A9P6F372_9FUNG|nr:hypothetical protein EC957_002587 [Mortierella hygrophila]
MRALFAFTVILASALLVLTPTATSLPPPQVPLRVPELPVQKHLLPSNLLQGDNVQAVLHQVASNLNQGVPDGSENLMQDLSTTGSSHIEMVAANDLSPVMQKWGLEDGALDQAYDHVHTSIERAVSEAVYFAQGFSLNWISTQVDGAETIRMSTLLVVVKVSDVHGGDDAWIAEIGHIHVSSGANTIVCYRCWFKSCCRNTAEDLRNRENIIAAISTFQVDWALNHLPEPPTDLLAARTDVSLSSSSEAPLWPGRFESLLRHFLGNSAENRDARKTYRAGLLAAVQNATLSHRQGFHNMEWTVREQGVVPMLQDMMLTCFSMADIEESIEEWWRRVYVEGQSDPVSVECEFATQKRMPTMPPRIGCVTSANVTTYTEYTWALIAPRDDLFDILFMEGEVSVTFEDCEPLEYDDQDDTEGSVHARFASVDDDQVFADSMIRWAHVEPADGTFRSMQYISKWKDYPSYVSKALMDFCRIASASSYLKGSVYDKRPSLLQQYQVPNYTTSPTSSLSFNSLMDSIGKFAETWGKLAKAIGSSSVTTIQRRVCLGFDALDYKASTGVMQGVASKNMGPLVEDVVDFEDLPRREDIRRLMSGVKYSTNFTWMAESMTYTNPDGEQSYFFFAKYGDALTDMADVVYSSIKSKFVVAKDMLIVHRQETSLFGLDRSDEMSIEYVPHTLTLNDTLILEMFWEMIAFHQLAISLGGEPPKYPDLSGLCDRSIP